MCVPTRGDKVEHVAKKGPRCFWQGATVNRILKRHAYIGTWYFGKTKMIGSKQVPRPRAEWIAVNVPRIIDADTFDRVQILLKQNKEQAIRSTKYKYLMGRRLKCDKCKYSYVGRTRGKNQYYYCKGKEQKVTKKCDMPQFRAADVNEAVWQWLKNFLLDPVSLRDGLEQYQNEYDATNFRLFDELQVVEDEISNSTRHLEKLIDLHLSNDISFDILKDKEEKLVETIANLRGDRDRLKAQIEQEAISDEQILQIEDLAASVRDCLEDADFDTKRQIIDLLDVRGKLAFEKDEKVVKIECQIELPPRSLVQTLPLSSTGAIQTMSYACQQMGQFR